MVVPLRLVVVGHGARTPAFQRQTRLGTVEGLDLTLLVAAEHEGVFRRVKVQAHDIDQLLLEAPIARELKAVLQMGFEPVALPDTADGRGAQPQMRGQPARAPVRGRRRLLMQRRVDNARLDLGCHPRCASRARCILQQCRDAAAQKASAPQRHLPPIELDLAGDFLVLPAFGGEHNDLGALLNARFHAPALGEDSQLTFGLRRQLDLLGNSHRSTLLERSRVPTIISSQTYSAVH